MKDTDKSPAAQITTVLGRMYERGLTTSTGGNLSVRGSDGVIWITPSATDKGNMLESDIVRITPDGDARGKYKPSVEHKFHRGIYQARPDIGAIIHAHSVGLITFSCTMTFPYTDLIPGSEIKNVISARVPCDPPGSDTLTVNVTEKFRKGYNTVLVDNHGVIIGADSLYRALLTLEELELSANLQLNAMTLIRDNPGGIITRGAKDVSQESAEPGKADKGELRFFLSRGYSKRLFTSGTGRISARKNGNSFYISARDCDRKAPKPDDILLVLPENKCAGEEMLHHLIYESNPEIGSIITATPENAMTIGILNMEYTSRCDLESCLALGSVKKFTQAEYIENTSAVARYIAHKAHACIIQNQFAVTCGKVLFDAFDKMEIMENGVKYILNLKRTGVIPCQMDRDKF